MPKRNGGFLVPPVINPPGRRCVQIWIPDEQTHIANFWGVLNFLTLWTEYERTGNDNGAQVANVWKEVYLSARQYFEAGEGCNLPLELRTVDGRIEWRPDPEAGWMDLGEVCPCPPVMTTPSYNPDVSTFDQRACNIAVGLVDWIMEKFNDAVDQIEATADTIASFDAILAMLPPAYLIADIILDMLNEVVDAGVAAARAFDSETNRDLMKQYLYCEMYFTGEMTQEIWEGFIAWANDEWNHFPSGTGWACWDYWARAFDTDAILSRARIVSYEDADCIEFGCGANWEQVFDFKTEQSLLGWTAFSPYPTPTIVANGLLAGVYLDTGASPDLSSRRVQLTHPTPYPDGATRITEVDMKYSGVTLGNGNSGVAPAMTVRLWTSANAQVGTETTGTPGITIPDGTSSKSLPGVSAVLSTYKVLVALIATERSSNTGQPVTGSGTLEKLTFRGLGKNPFIP